MLAYQDVCGTLQIVDTTNDQIIFDRLWRYDECEEISIYGHPGSGSVAFLPGGKKIAFVVTTERISITKPLFDLIIADISTGKDVLHLTDHIVDKTMEGITISKNGKWASLSYDNHYELRNLPDFSLVEKVLREEYTIKKEYGISPEGHLFDTSAFPPFATLVYSQDGTLRAVVHICDTKIFTTASNTNILTLNQPRISLGDQLQRFSNFFGENPYCRYSESLVFTSDSKYIYYSYRNHILMWRLPETQ